MDPSVEAVVVQWAARLRGAGVAVAADAARSCTAAMAEVGIERRSGVYWAGRATLVHRPEDIATYDDVFEALFDPWRGGAVGSLGDLLEPDDASRALAVDEPEPPAGWEPDGGGADRVAELRWADREVLRTRDFARCSPDELDELNRLLAQLRLTAPRRRSRRTRASRRARGPLDLRATARRSLHTGGEPMRTRHREPGQRDRRLVLLCDVSGSMEAYSRALVRFAHAAVISGGPVEVFTLGTRCTRVTRSLRTVDPDVALAGASAEVEDWSSGTRLGEGLQAFNDTWGQCGLARGAIVVVLSDGWDRGQPELLAEQTARLQRAAHRLIWVNPLKATPGFAPVAQGMAAALPFVDLLVDGHSLASLESLAEVIARSPERRGAGTSPERRGAGSR